MNTNSADRPLIRRGFAALSRVLPFLTLCFALMTATLRAQESQPAQPPQEPPAKPFAPHSVLRQGDPVVYQSFQPCRVVDTRNPAGDFGGPKLTAGATRNFDLVPSGGACGGTLPEGATALALNITITETENAGHLIAYPGGQPQPNTSVINWTTAGTTIANAVIVPVGADGSINVFATEGTHLVLDITGYFLSTLEAGDRLAVAADNSTAALVGTNAGTGAGVRGESAGGPAGFFAGNTIVTGTLGVGTETPGSRLTVAGVIESSAGGIKFPDGTVQTSASGDGSGNNFIRNTTAQQAASNFHISGNGTAGGTLSAATINAATGYNIGGQRALSAAGTRNLSAGINSGGNPAGVDNSFFGNGAGFSNTTGLSNSFFGSAAGGVNTTGSNNSFYGFRAGSTNSTGSGNSFFGSAAGVFNTTGGFNAFFGNGAGLVNTTGGRNTFLGVGAGGTNTTGSDLTLVGANTLGAANNLSFATAIGAGATATASNTIVLGRGSGADAVSIPGALNVNRAFSVGGIIRAAALGAGGFGALCRNASFEISVCSSSLRYKTNVAPLNSGMSFVDRLRPISFDWKDGGGRDVGFGAEEVAAIDPLFVSYNAAGEVEGVKYDRLSTIFVNALKEQQTQLEAQAERLGEQQRLIDDLRKHICSQNPRAGVCVGR